MINNPLFSPSNHCRETGNPPSSSKADHSSLFSTGMGHQNTRRRRPSLWPASFRVRRGQAASPRHQDWRPLRAAWFCANGNPEGSPAAYQGRCIQWQRGRGHFRLRRDRFQRFLPNAGTGSPRILDKRRRGSPCLLSNGPFVVAA
jgi:hypothetical protein